MKYQLLLQFPLCDDNATALNKLLALEAKIEALSNGYAVDGNDLWPTGAKDFNVK